FSADGGISRDRLVSPTHGQRPAPFTVWLLQRNSVSKSAGCHRQNEAVCVLVHAWRGERQRNETNGSRGTDSQRSARWSGTVLREPGRRASCPGTERAARGAGRQCNRARTSRSSELNAESPYACRCK